MVFDGNSTTNDVLSGMDLSTRTVLVTGGSTGLGAETARALASCGAQVTIVARSAVKLAKVAEAIEAETGNSVETTALELDKPDTIRAFAEGWLAKHEKLDILINNAGIGSPPLTRTVQGWEIQFATNHLGHFLLTNLLADAIKAGQNSRVINLSSGGHIYAPVDLEDPNYEKRGYNALEAYGQSKTANIWFTTELGRRWAEWGVTSFAVHPGIIETELTRDMAPEAIEAMEMMRTHYAQMFKSIPQGAATSCWAATSPDLDGKSGFYLEDCHIASAATDNILDGGYAPHAYDAEGARALWALSNSLLETDF